jgi:hypothetical protein
MAVRVKRGILGHKTSSDFHRMKTVPEEGPCEEEKDEVSNTRLCLDEETQWVIFCERHVITRVARRMACIPKTVWLEPGEYPFGEDAVRPCSGKGGENSRSVGTE